MTGSALQQIRRQRGMTQARAITELIAVGRRRGITLPDSASIKRRMSDWENGKRYPDSQYRPLLRELYGRTDDELGFPEPGAAATDAHSDAMEEVAARLDNAAAVDGDLLLALDQHTHRLRLLDRRLGAATVLDQICAHIETVRALMINTVLSRDRAALARILADAAALAGWQALDTAAITRAWQFFDIARSCGQQAGESAVYAHALGEQSYALAYLGRPDHALALLDEAHTLPRLPPLMRTWLTAAGAEMHAATGAHREALRGFDQADQLLPADHQDPSMPYLALSPAHLLRWRGHSLAMLGDSDALNYLIKALEDHDRSFVRAECGLRIDLATALKATGELAESRAQALTAKQLAVRIGSERNRRRVLPLTRPP